MVGVYHLMRCAEEKRGVNVMFGANMGTTSSTPWGLADAVFYLGFSLSGPFFGLPPIHSSRRHSLGANR
jgi:hypothetical protein